MSTRRWPTGTSPVSGAPEGWSRCSRSRYDRQGPRTARDPGAHCPVPGASGHLRTVAAKAAHDHTAASGFLADIDRMQLEVREYLSLHPTELDTGAA